MRRVRATIVPTEKQLLSHTLNMFVDLGIQHAIGIRYFVLCDLPDFTIFFHIFSQTARFSRGEKKKKNMKRVFWFSLQILSETFLILIKTGWDLIQNVYWSSRKALVTLVKFQLNLNFLEGFSKNNQITNFITIRPVGAELFHADGRRDMQAGRQIQTWRS